MVLYGAPVWSSRLTRTSRCRAIIYSLQRVMAMRVARGYRTISFEAATLLARFPPLDILAGVDTTVYNELRARQERGGEFSQTLEEFRREAHQQALITWRARLQEPRGARQRVVGAILPNFRTWLKKRRAHVTYRVTQVLTGHGCFGEYLSRIGRENTARCHHCTSDQDTAQHTVEVCPSWETERRVLVQSIGRDLSPACLVRAMLANDQQRDAVVSFCEAVMLQKETAERDRERADPTRRRRRVRRGGNNSR